MVLWNTQNTQPFVYWGGFNWELLVRCCSNTDCAGLPGTLTLFFFLSLHAISFCAILQHIFHCRIVYKNMSKANLCVCAAVSRVHAEVPVCLQIKHSVLGLIDWRTCIMQNSICQCFSTTVTCLLTCGWIPMEWGMPNFDLSILQSAWLGMQSEDTDNSHVAFPLDQELYKTWTSA